MKVKSIDEITKLCQEIATPLNIRIVEVEFKQGKNPALTVYIDKDGGMDLDTCEVFHNAIFDPLDTLDPTFGQPYTLNVSSPGADRPFKTEADFLSRIGKKVEVKLYSSVAGKKMYDGILLAYDKKTATLQVDKKTTFTLDMKNVVKMNDYIDFNQPVIKVTLQTKLNVG